MPPIDRRTYFALTAGALIMPGIGGCASWTDRETDPVSKDLPRLTESARALAVEVDFVPIELDKLQGRPEQAFWQWVDETVIDPELRKVWASNGLRVGRVLDSERLEAQLDSIRTDPNAVDQFLLKANVASDVSHGKRRVPMRWGRRYELPVRQPLAGDRVTLMRLDGQTVGRTLRDPQFLFAVTPTQGNTPNAAHVRLRPEIQHGLVRQKWVSSENALRMDHRRETWSLRELEWEFTGNEGDTLMITGTLPRKGVGGQMLSGSSADQKEHMVVLLLRLARVPSAMDNEI